MTHLLANASCFLVASTAALWLWGLIIRFSYDGFRVHVFRYHVLASLIALDEFANVLTAGRFAETISTRLGIAARTGLWWGVIGRDFLSELQRDHCSLALADDASRDAAEAEYLRKEEGQ